MIQFIQMLGHSEVILHCDNEPSILQLQRLSQRTRQAMGLKTRVSSSVAYDHAASGSDANPGGAASSSMANQGMMAPQTPPWEAMTIDSPRLGGQVHVSDEPHDEEVVKRAGTAIQETKDQPAEGRV